MPSAKGSGRGGRSGGADAPSRGAKGGRGNGASAHADESNFVERITFAGKLEHFVVAHDTWIHSRLYQAWPENALVEGAVVTGARSLNTSGEGKAKWRATAVRSVEAPSAPSAHSRNPAAAPRGEPFSELISFAGRAEQFVIAGRDTYVQATLVARWRPVFEGDRIIGARVKNSGGNSKWRAVAVTRVERDAGPPIKPQDAWLDESMALLARLDSEHKQQQQQQQTGGLVAGAPESAEMTGAEAPGMRSEAAGAGCCGTFDGRPTCTTAEAIAEALRLIDLAQLEIEALEQQKAEKEEAVTARATAASADAPPEVRMQQLLLQQQQRQRQPKQAHAQHDAAAGPAPPKQRIKPRHRDRADRQDGASPEATSVQPQGEAVAEFAY